MVNPRQLKRRWSGSLYEQLEWRAAIRRKKSLRTNLECKSEVRDQPFEKRANVILFIDESQLGSLTVKRCGESSTRLSPERGVHLHNINASSVILESRLAQTSEPEFVMKRL